MERVIKVKTKNSVSEVVVGESSRLLSNYLDPKHSVFVITDGSLEQHYPELVSRYPYHVMNQGEENKTLVELDSIYQALLKNGVDRHWTIVGIGGGIVTDVTGFVASTYQRGVDFGFVSTSLLAQVDASVGGKNGVNHGGFKNMIGVFNQPRFVICDTTMLSTLAEREFRAGLSEAIKAGVIKDRELFELFENSSFEDIRDNKSLLDDIIFRSIGIKAAVVEQDEREGGERKKLNFGHTLAHAIEKLSRNYVHGEAVTIGMVLACKIGVKMGITPVEVADRIEKVIKTMSLPTSCELKNVEMFDALKSDKKRDGDSIDLILPTTIGEASIIRVTFHELEQILLTID